MKITLLTVMLVWLVLVLLESGYQLVYHNADAAVGVGMVVGETLFLLSVLFVSAITQEK